MVAVARYAIDAVTLLRIVTDELPVDPGHQLVAPNVIRSQALGILFDAVRDGTITEAVALRRHERITEMKMRLLGDRVSRRTAWNMARDHGWPSIADAEYLAVAALQADALVTVDPAMAGRAEGIVTLADLAALQLAP